MQTEHILALLIAERDRLSRAIAALQGPAKRRGRPPGSGRQAATVATVSAQAKVPRKRKLSAAGRRAIVAAAKKRWALIRAGKAASPVAKAKGK
jgi:hypothetical protein